MSIEIVIRLYKMEYSRNGDVPPFCFLADGYRYTLSQIRSNYSALERDVIARLTEYLENMI